MNASRLKNLDGDKYPSWIVELSLIARALTYHQSILGGTLRFYDHFNTILSGYSIAADYNNFHTSLLPRSFIIANLQISNIPAAEARSLNNPRSNVTTGPTTNNILCKSLMGTITRQHWIRG